MLRERERLEKCKYLKKINVKNNYRKIGKKKKKTKNNNNNNVEAGFFFFLPIEAKEAHIKP